MHCSGLLKCGTNGIQFGCLGQSRREQSTFFSASLYHCSLPLLQPNPPKNGLNMCAIPVEKENSGKFTSHILELTFYIKIPATSSELNMMDWEIMNNFSSLRGAFQFDFVSIGRRRSITFSCLCIQFKIENHPSFFNSRFHLIDLLLNESQSERNEKADNQAWNGEN